MSMYKKCEDNKINFKGLFLRKNKDDNINEKEAMIKQKVGQTTNIIQITRNSIIVYLNTECLKWKNLHYKTYA